MSLLPKDRLWFLIAIGAGDIALVIFLLALNYYGDL